ncbi:MAG: GGDEF domain-containing protein [Selenomonadaceae bacterium]|nr:GGDEF domain-containing protein [Selenomonadaceae bacterium]
MYHCNLKIHLINCGAMDETIEKVQPLDHFTHEIFSHDNLSQVRLEEVDKDTIIIINNDESLSRNEIISYKKLQPTIVLIIDKPEVLFESDLSLFDHIWTLPLTPLLMRYHFKNLQNDLKMAKDFWLTQNYFNTLINSIPDLIWFKRKDGIHLKVNKAFCEAVAKDFNDVEGFDHCHIWGITPEQIAEGAYDCQESEDQVIAAGKTLVFNEEVLHSKRGLIQLNVYKSPILDENNQALGTVGFAQDITELLAQQETILKMAQTDALTNLTNRRYFYRYVNETRGDNFLTLCYIDLDNFKSINDNFGHPFGDAAILGAAEVLKTTFPDELVTRLGGDEFVVTIVGEYDIKDLIGRLEFLLSQANEFFKLHEAFKSLAMSIGVAWTTDPSISVDNLLRMSDEALYYCKKHNRGSYIFYDDVRNKILKEE